MLMHSIMDPTVGTFAGSIVEPTDVPTEDIPPPTEDILPASEHSPVRFTVGTVIRSGALDILAISKIRGRPKISGQQTSLQPPLRENRAGAVFEGQKTRAGFLMTQRRQPDNRDL